MNRVEYMSRLAELLQDVPVEERVAAMQYYNDYFNDAGKENEQQVMEELGSPEKVAAEMKAGLGSEADEKTASSDTGFSGYTYEESAVPEGTPDTEEKKPWTNKWVKIGLIVLVVAAALPILAPLAAGAVATVCGLVIAVFAVFLALVVASAVLVLVAVVLFIRGIMVIGTGIATALLLIGAGLLLGALGLIATVASIRLCIIVLPGIFRFFVNIIRKVIGRFKKEV